MSDHKFKVGDVVEFVRDGSIYIIAEFGARRILVDTIVESDPEWKGKRVWFSQLREGEIRFITHLTETSNVPAGQMPQLESTASPASGTRTSSEPGSRSQPSGRRGSARSGK